MKKIFFLLLFYAGSIYSQDNYSMKLVPDSLITIIQTGKRITYVYNTLSIDTYGKQLKVRNKRKLILTDEGTDDISSIRPHLFIARDSSDLMILMIDIMFDVLSGFNLYLLDNTESKLIGYFPVAGKMPGNQTAEEFFNSFSLFNNLSIEIVGTDIRISFSTDQIILRPGTDRETVVDGENVKFLYNGKKLKEVEEF
jgi:hypothetical protein